MENVQQYIDVWDKWSYDTENECGDAFDNFLFYVTNSPTGIVEFHSDYFDIGTFIYDYRYEKDFDKISKWLKKYGEEI